MWRQLMERLRRAAKRFNEFLKWMEGRGGRSPNPGSFNSSSSDDGMMTNRTVYEEESSRNRKRRIRPEEHGLTGDGRPIRGSSVPDYPNPSYRPVNRHQESLVPVRVPVRTTTTTTVSSRSSGREEESSSSRDNEVRTGESGEQGTRIQVTDRRDSS